jgi:hypothetical protein
LWSCSLCSFLQPPVTSSVFGPNVNLGTLFSNTLSLCSLLKIRDQFSQPYRNTRKMIVMYILIFTFLDSRREIMCCYCVYVFFLYVVITPKTSTGSFPRKLLVAPKEILFTLLLLHKERKESRCPILVLSILYTLRIATNCRNQTSLSRTPRPQAQQQHEALHKR